MQSETLELLSTNIVRAGAGAGKTRNLTLRVLDWVEQFIAENQRFPKLVVTTFTVKATQELKERLLLFASERGNEDLLEYVRSGSYLHISTIHGVLSSLLRKYGHSIGLDSGFEVMSGIDQSKSSLGLLRRILLENEQSRKLLNHYSFKDLSTYFNHYYEAYLNGEELKPIDKESITEYLNKEWKSLCLLSAKVSQEIHGDLNSIGIESKSSDNWRNLAEAMASLKEDADLNSSFSMVSNCLGKVARFPTNPKNPVVYDETKEKAKRLWSMIKDYQKFEEELFPYIDLYVENNALFQELASAWMEQSIRHRMQQSKISMADIELLSAYLMREKSELAHAFSEEYDYWLIDEFQDTSPEQLNILRKLISDRPYYVVGDPQQSIYFFRGADQSLFLKEEDHIVEQGGGKNILMKNYRTEPSTMAFINEFMGQYGFEEMETRDEALLSKDNMAAEFLLSDEPENENQLIANRIVGLLNDGVAPSEICVLGRTKKSLEEIASLLSSKEVPCYLHTSGNFFTKREILDLLFLLKFLVHPYDRVNLVGLLRSPWFYVSDSQLFELCKGKNDLWTEAKDLDLESIKKLIELKDYAEEYGVISALEKSVYESGILESCRKYDPSGKREANIWKLLVNLREAEHQAFFSPLELLRVAEEFASVSNEGETEAAAALEPNRIQLMTIHASKGLEFGHVFVVHMNKKPNLTNILPFYLGDNGNFSIPVPVGEESTKRLPPMAKKHIEEIKEKELQESFRLLYVALTRAEKKLYLSWNGEVKNNSWIDGLSWDLSDGKHEKEYYSYEVLQAYEDQAYKKAVGADTSLRETWASSLPSIYQPLETDSVSRLLEQRTEYGRQAKKGDENEFFSPDKFHSRMDKAAMGTKIHAVLERFAAARSIGDDFELSEEEATLQKYIDYLEGEALFPFSELIEDCQLEWGFVMKHGDKTIEGQVDFWGRDLNGEIWVMDYKTGSSRFKSKAMDQLRIYALALSKLYPEQKINMVSIFLEEMKSFSEEFSLEHDFIQNW